MSTTHTDAPSSTRSIGPNDAGYVLPKPGRATGKLVLGSAAGRDSRFREAEVARSLGARTTELLECQQRLLGELRGALNECESDIGEATRARLQGHVRTAISVLDWCEAVQEDLQRESRWAAKGLQPIDLMSFCRDVAGAAAAEGLSIQLQGHRERRWWGDAALLGDAVQGAIALVRARAGDAAGVVIEFVGTGEVSGLRIAGLGEPTTDVDPELVDAFRAAAARLGAKVAPDGLGPGGVGLVLQLPEPTE